MSNSIVRREKYSSSLSTGVSCDEYFCPTEQIIQLISAQVMTSESRITSVGVVVLLLWESSYYFCGSRRITSVGVVVLLLWESSY